MIAGFRFCAFTTAACLLTALIPARVSAQLSDLQAYCAARNAHWVTNNGGRCACNVGYTQSNDACVPSGGGDGGGGVGNVGSMSLPSSQLDMATQLGGIFGRALGEAIRGNSAAQRQAAAEAERARGEQRRAEAAAAAERARIAAEEARKAAEEARRLAKEAEDRRLEGIKRRLTGSLKGQSSGLTFKGMKTDPAEPKPESGGLKFKLGDTKVVERPPKSRQPSESWEQYKKDVLEYQRSLALKDPANKENNLWCKGHVPLSMAGNRASWEARCNPRGEIQLAETADAPVPEAVASVGKGGNDAPDKAIRSSGRETPAAGENAAATDPAPESSGKPGFKFSEDDAPQPEPEAVPREIPAAPVEPAKGDAPTDEASDQQLVVMGGQRAPAATQTVEANAASAAPALRDSASPTTGGLERAKAESEGGFDAKGPMVGRKAAAAGASRAPSASPVRYEEAAPGASAPRGLLSSGPTAGPSPAISGTPYAIPRDSGEILVGNPDRYREFFKKQYGQTCSLVAAMQILGDLKMPWSEDALFLKALELGIWQTSWKCSIPREGSVCWVYFDPATKACTLINGDDIEIGPDTGCRQARLRGGMSAVGQGKLLEAVTGRPIRNSWIPPIKTAIENKNWGSPAEAASYRGRVLGEAREEVLEALKRGQPVQVTVDAKTLWRQTGPSGMHAILVTAAVVRYDGSVVGYYVNDSGAGLTGDYRRFVPQSVFDMAWLNDDLQRVYLK